MTQGEKLNEIFIFLNLAFRRIMDLRDDLKKELKDLLISEGVKDIDELEKKEALGNALLLEDKIEKLMTQADHLNDLMDGIIRFRL